MTDLATDLNTVLSSGYSLSPGDNVSVYFLPDGLGWSEPGVGVYTSLGWNTYEQGQVMAALAQFSNVANISFTQIDSPFTADVLLGTREISGASGYFYLPTISPQFGVFDSTEDRFWSDAPGGALEQGGVGFELFLHEFGHGLGMMHPHDGGASGTLTFPGVTSQYDLGTGFLNQSVYTVMTYNSGWYTAPHGLTPSTDYGYQGTLGALDIAWLQATYGANMNYATGNDVYVLPDTNESGTFYSTIWDAGGIDMIRYAGDQSVTINLMPATLQVGEGGGGYMSYVHGVHGGFTIAADVTIENAISGAGDDILIGNAANNQLSGNGGVDLIMDGLGDDILRGGDDDDVLLDATGTNALRGGAGSDVLRGGIEADVLEGNDGDDYLIGDPSNALTGGADILKGGAGNDAMMGGAGADSFWISPNEGSDTILALNSNLPTEDLIDRDDALPILTGGADFQVGLDHVRLTGFSTVTSDNVMSFVTETTAGTVFAAEGTSLLFSQVFGLDSDDFVIIS